MRVWLHGCRLKKKGSDWDFATAHHLAAEGLRLSSDYGSLAATLKLAFIES